MKRLLTGLCALLAFAQAAAAETVREVVSFLGEDGKELVMYEGLRSSWGSYNLYYEKGKEIDDYLYFFPNQYSWDRSGDANDILRIPQGDYSFVDIVDMTPGLTESADGVFTYATERPDADAADPHYGYWNQPQSFDKFVYAWILPDNIEIVEASSNRAGEWVRRDGAVAFFAENANNLSFVMRFRFKSAASATGVREAIGTVDGVSVDEEAAGLRLTLADRLLFASGSAALTADGLALIRDVAGAVDFSSGAGVIVEGHTDNVPIQGALTATFPTNWELSADRALAVVKAMEAAGAPPDQLEARAFGEHRPVASNASAEGRAANRRISILIANP
ncbi:MAG: flagellar motor protein MotB [Hyphomonas sp.]|nr:flagellar motor protein MotB [Hyphomonas sp.]